MVHWTNKNGTAHNSRVSPDGRVSFISRPGEETPPTSFFYSLQFIAFTFSEHRLSTNLSIYRILRDMNINGWWWYLIMEGALGCCEEEKDDFWGIFPCFTMLHWFHSPKCSSSCGFVLEICLPSCMYVVF